MLRILHDMPPGTVGVEATGRVTDEDYRNVLAPALEGGSQSDTPERSLRLLYVLGDGLDGHSAGTAWEDTKLWTKHLRDWNRVAIVSDEDWLENAMKAFSWLMPGEVKVFETDEVREAKAWLVGIELDDD